MYGTNFGKLFQGKSKRTSLLKETNMEIRIKLFSFLMVIFASTLFMAFSSALAGSTSVTSTGITFSDGTTQTTAASGGSDLVTVKNFQPQNCMGIQSLQAIEPCFITVLDSLSFCALHNIK